MDNLKLYPASRMRGRIVLPASKSISNRALIINALSGSTLLPENLSDSDDTEVMLRALASLGPTPEASPIDIGAAGTSMRFLTALLSVTPGEHVITGSERMRHRPISILVDALRQLGADITYVDEEGFPPLRIVGKAGLEGGSLTVAGNVSSQYISALLMIAPTLKRGLHLTLTGEIASRPYLDMTLSMMRDFGAKAEWQGKDVIEVQPGSYLQRPYHIESDWSAASYWYEMVAVSPDADAQIDLVGLHHDSIQGDSKVWQMFGQLGVTTQYFVEPDGTEVIRLRKGGGVTCHFSCDFTHQPDLAQTLAVTCALLGVPFHLYGLHSLRIKETDRIAALMKELGKVFRMEERDGELLWEGYYEIGDWEELLFEPLEFDTYEDHRMAMSLAPVCLRVGGEIIINNPQVVSKSYPGFWDDLKKVGFIVC
ncbi:MAG: 3-phosphoshikimate 1-carboxyvinyltransferase [Bacteroidaceae bacterium]|nr:3-phosphoshikimate 1-carboxyvinyltransferase [Bacteroidaceae bacterium]